MRHLKTDSFLLVTIVVTLFLASCSNNVKREQPVVEKVKMTKPAAEKPKEVWPTRGNITSYFTKYGKENQETIVVLHTTLGDITIELFEDTPLHRSNFIHHAKRGLYDKTIFYRVVPDFMIQGGNSDHDQTVERRKGVESYYIPNEVKPEHIHQRGAVAMAMSYHNNPENKSSQYDYYIVTGKRFTDLELDATEEEYGQTFSDEARNIYKTIGGSAHLDGKHTVFGRVIKGMDVVDKISNTPRDTGDWPINDVFIDYELIE